MNQTVPPVLPSGGWLQRNWKWFLPTIVLTVFALPAAFIALVYGITAGAMRSSDPYQFAMDRASSNPKVVDMIGEPIKPGFFITGSLLTKGSSASAELSIPIFGPKNEARVYLDAKKHAGEWNYNSLIVEFTDSSRLDLLAEEEVPVTAGNE